MDKKYIEIKGVTKIFGRNKEQALKLIQSGVSKDEILAKTGAVIALENINLYVSKGSIFAVIGLSGSGKSTLIRHINRLVDPDLGGIHIKGRNIMQLNSKELMDFRRNEISMVFQNFGLLPHWTVEENVAYGLFVKGVKRNIALEEVKFYLKRVGLLDYAKKYPNQLSGGMMQRVGLARALAVGSDIILMDEPFSALDPIIRKRMQCLLLDLQDEFNKTIIIISHDLDEAFSLSRHIAVLNGGRLEQVGSPKEIMVSPSTKYVEKLLEVGVKQYSVV